MGQPDVPMHYVCTLDEARELARGRESYWVRDCYCREGKGECQRSRMDVCIWFVQADDQLREASADDVAAIFQEAVDKRLVARPFRTPPDMQETGGICLCCDCCCGYFLGEDAVCDKGRVVEQTDMGACTHCGECAKACYFGARTMADGKLKVDRQACYGCGLCAEVCPVECTEMVGRA